MAEDIQGFILSIVGIGVVLAVGLIVLAQLGNSIGTPCQNVNESSRINGTDRCQYYTCFNNSRGATGSGIYAPNSTYANCFNATGAAITGEAGILQIEDKPSTLTAAFNSTRSITTQLSTVPNWIGILITVALAFIVLGYFYNRG